MKIAFCLAFLLAFVTQGQAEDYYVYHDADGKLVLSNKKPPPGSKIIRHLTSVTDKEAPQDQPQEPGKTPPTAQTEDSPKPFKSK